MARDVEWKNKHRRCAGKPEVEPLFSAGQSQLLHWATQFNQPRPRLYLVHGEDEKKQVLQETFKTQCGWDANLPALGETITI